MRTTTSRFADYHDPARVHWGSLRVWNDDTIAPKSGFPTHPHRDMEIITYVRSGRDHPPDSLGNEGRTEAGDVQVMSAGTRRRAIPSTTSRTRKPRSSRSGSCPMPGAASPIWGARQFPKDDRHGAFVPLASGFEATTTPFRSAPMRVCSGRRSRPAKRASYGFGDGRKGYLVPATGAIEVAGRRINARDGVAISDLRDLEVKALEDSEIVLVDAA